MAGIEPVIPASERPQTHVLECAATGIGILASCFTNIRNDYLRNRSQVRYHSADLLDNLRGLDQSLVSRITMWMISVLKKTYVSIQISMKKSGVQTGKQLPLKSKNLVPQTLQNIK